MQYSQPLPLNLLTKDLDKEGNESNLDKEDLMCQSDSSVSESGKKMKSVKSIDLRNRSDVKNKTAIRIVRAYYRNLFKINRKKVMKQRLINTKLSKVFASMKSLLCEIFAEGVVDNDLVYYLIGILTFKPIHILPVSKQVKDEIKDFLSCVRGYSMKKFHQTFKSKSLVTL